MVNTPSLSDAKPRTDASSSNLSLIVFGRDKDGKPHASSFSEADAALATKAASLMGMRTLALDTDEHRAVALQLPLGRVFASGKGFVPFVKKGLYDRLSALAGPSAEASTGIGSTEAGGPSKPSGTDTAEAAEQRPASWLEITTGSTVLIHGGGDDGWYEAEVVDAKADDLFTLRWRDWPELPILVRTRAHIALLNPVAPSATA